MLEQEVAREDMRNKDRSEFCQYYHAYADVCALGIGFHMQRVREGQPFATYEKSAREPSFGPFTEYLGLLRKKTRLIQEFAEGVRQSFTESSDALFVDQGVFGGRARELIEKVAEYGQFVRGVTATDRYQDNFNGGISTASRTITQLVAIFHGLKRNARYARSFAYQTASEFAIAASTACAKISLTMLTSKELEYQIGLGDPENFGLIDLSALPAGLDRSLLVRMGYRAVLGCPASMKPSRECSSFLKEQGLSFQGTCVGQFARMIDEEYCRLVIPWVDGLGWYKKRMLIAKEDRRIIDGRIVA